MQEFHGDCVTALRFLSADMVEKAQSGHPGMPMGAADILTALLFFHLRFTPSLTPWPNRDRFVLSAGHGSALLYAASYLLGYPDTSLDTLKQFRQLHSPTAGHPEYGALSCVEMTTGPLGQGLASAVGMALAERVKNEALGDEICNHHTYVLCGEGCLMEGISYEAASLAGHLKLNRLIVLLDHNKITIDGDLSLSFSEDIEQRFHSLGWNVLHAQGLSVEDVSKKITQAHQSTKPVLIICKTIIGYGAPGKEGSASTHGSPLGAETIQRAREHLQWPYPPFFVPDSILSQWRSLAALHTPTVQRWYEKYSTLSSEQKLFFQQKLNLQDFPEAQESLETLKKTYQITKLSEPSRTSSGKVLASLSPHLPHLLGGSADLTPSNNTRPATMALLNADNFAGRYLHYGIREHAMAALMNGLALHGGIIPYSGTFLVFSDYARPAIRLAALMNLKVIYLMTHDSVLLGEDGPTHQPIEHLTCLRAIPNLTVFRPCSAQETVACWSYALSSIEGPSLFSLSRQNLPFIEQDDPTSFIQWGAYLIKKTTNPQINLMATGSEVSVALETATLLENRYQLSTSVISVPCLSLFQQSPLEYQQKLLNAPYQFSIEAGLETSWWPLIRSRGLPFGIHTFGLSAPAEDIKQYFSVFSPESLTKKIKDYIDHHHPTGV